jgi:antitoxin component of MazEF toxin-antitoxin module
MAKRSDKRNIRKLTKLGGHSLGVTIPIDLVRALKWRERQKVVVTKRGQKLTIEDWKK